MMPKSKQSSLKSLQSLNPFTNKPVLKQGSRTSKFRNNNEDEGDIVIKACCPNCRYIFKVVNENKLNALKKKLQNLQSIQQQKTSKYSPTFTVNSPENTEKKSRNQTPRITSPADQTPKDSLKRQQILSKSMVEQSLISKSKISNTSQNKKVIGTQTIQPLNIQKSISRKSPINLTERSSSKKQHSKTPNKQNKLNINNVKTPIKTGRKTQLQKVSDNIQKDIKQMKKYLRSTAQLRQRTQKQEGQSNYNQNLLTPKSLHLSQFQILSPKKKNLAIDLDKISELSKSRHEIVVNRKCQACSVAQVDTQLAFRAGTSVILQEQLKMIAKYVEESPSTPSYIKCLQQIVNENK